jgi:hypothetical protein
LGGAGRRALAVQDTREARRPPQARKAGTTGACRAVRGLPRLTGDQALSRGAPPGAGDDVERRFPPRLDAAHGRDHRWGRAPEAWWTAGRDRLAGAVSGQAIGPSAVAVARRPTATTRRNVCGAYARDAAPAGPWVAGGERREPRPDREPRLVGRTVPAEGGPGGGPVPEGTGRARPAPRWPLTPRRPPRPALGEPRLGAERQVFAGATRAGAAAPRVGGVTWVPQTVGLRPAWGDRPARRPLPRRWAQPGRRPGERERDHAAAVVRP